MTWTYNLATINTSQLAQVRFLIGDTILTDQLMQDEEINYAIAARGNVYGAAADCCRSISSTFARQVDSAVGDLRASFSQKSKAYAQNAIRFEDKLAISGGAVPFGGGLTVADKMAAEADASLVPPQFKIGMEDNFLPVGDSGNESILDGNR